MTRWKLWVLLCAVFVSGIAIGAAGTGYVASRSLGLPHGKPGQKHADIREFMVNQMARQVGMDEEQKGKARAVLEKAHPRFEAVRSRVKPEMDRILDDATAQIKPFLDPQQQAKLDAFVAHIKMDMPPPGPPPGPPPME